MQVAKWGNSLAIRLPAVVVEALNLKEGDEIDIAVAGERGFDVARQSTRREWLERLRAYQGRLPADFKFDRGDSPVCPFAFGDVVVHRKLGKGVIASSPVEMTNGDDEVCWRVEVQFDESGLKTLVTSVLRLESEIHQIDRLRHAVADFGALSTESDSFLREVGKKILSNLNMHLHRERNLVRGVPPRGQWKPDVAYRDSIFSSHHEALLTLKPLEMGVAIKIENLSDAGALWVRLTVSLEQVGGSIQLSIGEKKLPSLVTIDDSSLTDISRSIVNFIEALFVVGSIDSNQLSDAFPIGFLRFDASSCN